MNVLRPKAMARKCGVTPITVHRWTTDPKYAQMGFPKPIPLGENSVGYIEEEADEWLSARAAERDDGFYFDAVQAHGDQQERDALLFPAGGVGTGEAEHPVGDMRHGGPDFGAVDGVVAAVFGELGLGL